jgi:hypothetical protein
LRQLSTFFKRNKYNFLLFVPIIVGSVIGSCSLEKKSTFNRNMQNLTAHYNILFDANQILLQKQADYTLAFIDSYNEILNVYQDTAASKSTTPDKDLQSAIDKAYKIINFKEQSHYQGDAYLVLGKANFLAADYFSAGEFFTYVINTYPQNKKLVQEARVWKARTLMYLDHVPEAKLVIDTALQNIDPKKSKTIDADIYATKLQYDIDAQDYADGEAMAKQAVDACHTKKQRLRWTFILAQIQELNGKNHDALVNYTRIAKSNAVFEMSFNADLNRIRIEDAANGIKETRVQRLQSLLKNPNNEDFKDQIYYQIGQLKYYDNAIKNYKLSVRNSKRNQNQKGLSYLRIADINFNIKANYVIAKKYYDSTLTALSPNYPGYLLIQKKTNNLQLLTDKLQIIAMEDTLQMLAKLDDKARAARIDLMVTNEILQEQAIANNAAISASAANNSAPGTIFAAPGGSNFYFYNSNAVSQGYNTFKQLWGNRKLEDDWRRSNRTAIAPVGNDPNNIYGPATPSGQAKSANSVTAANYRQQIIQNLPLTPELLAQSNLKIFNAYFDIANFYRDILDDKTGAIAIYETILTRFPNNGNLPAIYYSLYRLYTELNDPKADIYKNKLLKDYADTPFAKVILDPDYSKKLGDKNAVFNTVYNSIYELYARKKYAQVITQVDAVLKEYPENSFAAQLYYLRAIAAGHQEPVAPFQADLQQIVTKYPNDRLVTPLANQHLNYITANLVDMSARHFVLLDNDTTEVPFSPRIADQKQTNYRKPGYFEVFSQVADVRKPVKKPELKKDSVIAAAPVKQPVKSDSIKTIVPPELAVNAPPVVKKPVVSSIFSMRDSTNYYFVINVSNNTTNLSSSRFGIGQFNRVNLPNSPIKHNLAYVGNNNQLIYVGLFNSIGAVKAYARAIIPLMSEIMKVSSDKYTYFIITKENLNKLADKKTLDSYMDFYQGNY